MEKHSSKSESSVHLSNTRNRTSSWRDAFILMRIPFSIYLMPVFWFALSNLKTFDNWIALWIFIIIHVFLYPASNGYNSYFDKDEDSVGGLQSPPPINNELLRLVMIFDATAIFGAWFISPLFAMMILMYTLVSKAYSFEGIRLKKYPIISTTIVTFFQGAFTYAMVIVGLGAEVTYNTLLFAAISTILISGSYPLTQIYQHDSDRERGDKTISMTLGIKGTFLFSAFMFALGFALLLITYYQQTRLIAIGILLIASFPIGFYFIRWMWLSWQDEDHVNHRNTMNMNAIASLGLSAAFIGILVLEHYLGV
jgi:1,4-dihydroxy-2-naphthoate octaprenyltransferase